MFITVMSIAPRGSAIATRFRHPACRVQQKTGSNCVFFAVCGIGQVFPGYLIFTDRLLSLLQCDLRFCCLIGREQETNESYKLEVSTGWSGGGACHFDGGSSSGCLRRSLVWLRLGRLLWRLWGGLLHGLLALLRPRRLLRLLLDQRLVSLRPAVPLRGCALQMVWRLWLRLGLAWLLWLRLRLWLWLRRELWLRWRLQPLLR